MRRPKIASFFNPVSTFVEKSKRTRSATDLAIFRSHCHRQIVKLKVNTDPTIGTLLEINKLIHKIKLEQVIFKATL